MILIDAIFVLTLIFLFLNGLILLGLAVGWTWLTVYSRGGYDPTSD